MIAANSDILLMQKYNIGDSKAFEEIYNRFWSPLYFTAFKFIRDSEEAKDIVITIINKLCIKKPYFDHIAKLKSYLFLMTRNKCIDFIRSQKKFGKVKIEYNTNLIEVEVLNDNLDAELGDLVLKIVEKLPERSKEVVILYYVCGMRYREIAEKMNIAERTVESHLRAAIKKIRNSVFENKFEI